MSGSVLVAGAAEKPLRSGDAALDISQSLNLLQTYFVTAASEAHKLFTAVSTAVAVFNKVAQVATKAVSLMNVAYEAGVASVSLDGAAEVAMAFFAGCNELSAAGTGVLEAASVGLPVLEGACLGAAEVVATLASPLMLGMAAMASGAAMSVLGLGLLLSAGKPKMNEADASVCAM